jgi:F0F1-type ATP synthase epsilon subunit
MIAHVSKPDSNNVIENLTSITLPTTAGEIEVLEDHAELFCILQEGSVTCTDHQQLKTVIPVSNGLVYMNNNEVTILF